MLGIARFLLLQALAFRGHDESKTSRNKGNFMEMLEWYRKKDPKAALVTGENAPGNNQMSCPMVQKDLARACAEETSELIKSEIGDRWFAVLVDEARDASIKEQMVVVVRFVNDKGSVIERFLGIEYVFDTTSTSLKKALDTMLRRYGLSIFKIRGQGYDGASNMRGQFHGLQRLVLNENPYAFYIHCFAHQLQLVVVSIAKCCGSTFDFFNYVTSIVNVVSASCKRKDQLLQSHHDKLIEQLDSGTIFSRRGKNQEISLARPGDTRWGTHHKTLARLMIMWSSVLEVLENISEDGTDGEKKTTTSGLIQRMESFEFVFILHLMIRVLGMTQDLSQCLQKKNQNIVRAIGLIGSVMRNMNEMRENGCEALFEEVKEFCLLNNIEIPNMEDMIPVRGRSRCRGAKLVSYYHHFHHGIFNVVIDQVYCELNNRFPERSTQLLRCVACLDPRDSFANFEVQKLVELAKIYKDDLCDYDCIKLAGDLRIFIDEVRNDDNFDNCTNLGNLAEKMVQTERDTTFPWCIVSLNLH
ncbi:uncharacterized protein [Miscanthus floridulus]|uniref:uncharacterized protein n=1 Tax=Miscanthus floridulus TaxID=154761 RepID=UPI0034589CD4